MGEFDTDDRITVLLSKTGSYLLTNFELTNRYEMQKIVRVEKFSPETVVTAVHYDGSNKEYYVKRFKIETTTVDKAFSYISEADNSRLVFATTHPAPIATFTATAPGKGKENVEVNLGEFIDVKGWKAMGNKLDRRKVSRLKFKEPELPETEIPETLHTGDQVEWSGDDLKQNGNGSNGQGELF